MTPEDWNKKGSEFDEIRENMLGWDITDYGLGKFDEVGFSLMTIRNGNLKMDKYTKTYGEKLLVVKEGQMAPMHFHWNKMEDIINRGGDVLLGEVSMCNDDENDNRFYEPIGRFPKIEEDEAPYRLLCNEYPDAK